MKSDICVYHFCDCYPLISEEQLIIELIWAKEFTNISDLDIATILHS